MCSLRTRLLSCVPWGSLIDLIDGPLSNERFGPPNTIASNRYNMAPSAITIYFHVRRCPCDC